MRPIIFAILLVSACENGSPSVSDADATSTNDVAVPAVAAPLDSEVEGHACVRRGDAWGCTDRCLVCVRGWCQSPDGT